MSENNKSSSSNSSSLGAKEASRVDGKKLGTLFGVFLPTILNIFGVIMYLRFGWVVGNAGLVGAIVIILMAYFITGTTALSLSSITTNIRVGSGGMFSIISQSLGVEVGGSVAIQFYLAQTFASAMYIYGFMEAWSYLFPQHPSVLVILAVYLIIMCASYLSMTLAFRLQFVVMLGLIIALISMFAGVFTLPELQKPEMWGEFSEAPFWILFAVFFPAATDIMVGSSMSGNLKEPRFSIPVGTLAAWGFTLAIYLALAVWYSVVATSTELQTNSTISVDRAFWGPAVLIGVLSSCFNAALSSSVVAPRVLQALGNHHIVPYSDFFAKTHKEEPRNATLLSAVLMLIVLGIGELNLLAVFVTICFLLAYLTMNSVLLIENRLNLLSFRPTFRVPFWIPLAGTVSCLFAIIVISPFWGFTAILMSMALYIYLDYRGLQSPWETVHGGLFENIAYWIARKVVTSKRKSGFRAWKPNILMPIERHTQLTGQYRLLFAMVHPQGSIQVIGLMKEGNRQPLFGVDQVIHDLQKKEVFANSTIIDSTDYLQSLDTCIDILSSSIFHPNILFISLTDHSQEIFQTIYNVVKQKRMALILMAVHPEMFMGQEQTINIWVRDQSPAWELSFNLSNLDLSFLMGYKLLNNWNADLRVICVVREEETIAIAKDFLHSLMIAARIPKKYEILVEHEDFKKYLTRAPQADLNIFGLSDPLNKERMIQMSEDLNSSCFFVLDSGYESAVA